VSSIEHQMTEIYCFVDDFLRAHPAQARWRHSPNRKPRFTDAEVISIALLPSSFGCDTLKRAYKLVRDNWRSAFPHLVSYKQWVQRLHALSGLVGQLLRAITLKPAEADNFYLMDSKPIPVCHPIRHGRARLLREDGAYFGKTSKGWFFGFKLHRLKFFQPHLEKPVVSEIKKIFQHRAGSERQLSNFDFSRRGRFLRVRVFDLFKDAEAVSSGLST
jgi:hypothetical protein